MEPQDHSSSKGLSKDSIISTLRTEEGVGKQNLCQDALQVGSLQTEKQASVTCTGNCDMHERYKDLGDFYVDF